MAHEVSSDESLDPGGIGDVKVSGRLIGDEGAIGMMKAVEPPSQAEVDKLLRKKRRRDVAGKYKDDEKRGQPARGLLKASVRSRAKGWDFKRVMRLVPLSRDRLLVAANYRDALEDAIRERYAGTKPGFYAWNRGQTAVRHEMRAMMCEQLLDEAATGVTEALTLEQKLLVVKHLCDASDNRDAALNDIGLDTLCQGQEEFDPWTAPIEGEANAATKSDTVDVEPAASGREVDGGDGCVLSEAGGAAAEG